MADLIPLTPAEMLVQQQAIDRQRKIADYLQQQSLTPTDGQMVSGRYVAPSMTQYLAKLAQGLMGKTQQQALDQKQKDLVSQQGDLQRYLYGIGGGQQSSSPTPQISDAPKMPVGSGMSGMGAGSIVGRDPVAKMLMNSASESAQPSAASQGSAQPSNAVFGSRLIPGMSPYTAFQMATDPKTEAAYASAFLDQFKPTDLMKNARWMGRAPDEIATAERAKDKKAGIIELQPGTTARDLATGEERFQPKVGEGIGLLNGAASVIPGYAAANADIVGSAERAKAAGAAGFDMVTVNTPNGPVMMTRAQAAQRAGGGSPSQASENAGFPAGVKLPAPTPTPGGGDRLSIMQSERRDILSRPDGDPRKAGDLQAIDREIAALTKNPAAVGIPLQDEGAAKASTVIGEGFGKRFNDIQDAGFAANQKINKAAQLGGLLDNLKTGKLAPAGYEIAAYAKSLGIPVSEKLDNAQAAKSVANSIALELRNPSGGAGMPGAMSDADRNYLSNMVAGLDKTPGANKMLIDAMQKLAQRDADISQLARDYKKRTGKFDEGFYDELRQFSQSNPLFQSPAGAPAKASPIDDLLKKYGGKNG